METGTTTQSRKRTRTIREGGLPATERRMGMHTRNAAVEAPRQRGGPDDPPRRGCPLPVRSRSGACCVEVGEVHPASPLRMAVNHAEIDPPVVDGIAGPSAKSQILLADGPDSGRSGAGRGAMRGPASDSPAQTGILAALSRKPGFSGHAKPPVSSWRRLWGARWVGRQAAMGSDCRSGSGSAFRSMMARRML